MVLNDSVVQLSSSIMSNSVATGPAAAAAPAGAAGGTGAATAASAVEESGERPSLPNSSFYFFILDGYIGPVLHLLLRKFFFYGFFFNIWETHFLSVRPLQKKKDLSS